MKMHPYFILPFVLLMMCLGCNQKNTSTPTVHAPSVQAIEVDKNTVEVSSTLNPSEPNTDTPKKETEEINVIQSSERSNLSTPIKTEKEVKIKKKEPKPMKATSKPSKPVKSTKKKVVKTPVIKKSAKKYASMTFEKMLHDFGEIKEGDIINHSFKFTNTSNVPLEITGATASCGCTRPSFPFITIAPGESNQISVTYNSVSKEADQTVEIMVEANTSPKLTLLKMQGTVIPKPKKQEEEVEVEVEVEESEIPKDGLENNKKTNTPKKIIKGKDTKITIQKDTVR